MEPQEINKLNESTSALTNEPITLSSYNIRKMFVMMKCATAVEYVSKQACIMMSDFVMIYMMFYGAYKTNRDS